MITLKRFRRIEQAVRAAGYSDIIEWSETIQPPTCPDDFARRVVFVICSSGMSAAAAEAIYEKCVAALDGDETASSVFPHPGKAAAIDIVWRDRKDLFDSFLSDDDALAFCAELPFVGPVTRYHLAKNLGADVAKPDVHLARLAKREGVTPQQLCQRLAAATGYRAATIDTILWRACAAGVLNSTAYLERGWRAVSKSQEARHARVLPQRSVALPLDGDTLPR